MDHQRGRGRGGNRGRFQQRRTDYNNSGGEDVRSQAPREGHDQHSQQNYQNQNQNQNQGYAQQNQEGRDRVCYNCGRTGHIARKCRAPTADGRNPAPPQVSVNLPAPQATGAVVAPVAPSASGATQSPPAIHPEAFKRAVEQVVANLQKNTLQLVEIEPKETVRERVVTKPVETKTISQVVNAWQPKANKGSALEKKFKELGFEPIYNKVVENETAPHPVSAAVRQVLTARSFGVLSTQMEIPEDGTWQEVCSVYASSRDAQIIKAVNTLVNHGPKLKVALYRPLMVENDIARINDYMRKYAVVDYEPYRHYLMVDVYMVEGDEEFSPSFVRTLLFGKGESATLVWVGHRFSGEAGLVHGEGGWYREDNEIIFRSDLLSSTYKRHPPLDWMWEANHAALDDCTVVWSQKDALGDMVMVMFQLVSRGNTFRHGRCIPVPPKMEVMQTVSYTTKIPLLKTLSQQLGFNLNHPVLSMLVHKETLFLSRSAFEKLTDFIAVRSYSELATKQTANKVKEILDTDMKSRLFYHLFPNKRPLIEQVVFAIMAHNITDRKEVVETFNTEHGATANGYNHALKSIGSGGPPIWKQTFNKFAWSVGLVIGVAGIGMLITRNPRLLRRMAARHLQPGSAVKGLHTVVSLLDRKVDELSSITLPALPSLPEINWTFYKMDLSNIRELVRVDSTSLWSTVQDWIYGSQNSGIFAKVWREHGTWAILALTAPFYEEVLKKLHPMVTPLLMLTEACQHVLTGGLQGLVGYLPAAWMHWATSKMPYGTALKFHFSFNAAVVIMRLLSFWTLEYYGVQTVVAPGALPVTSQMALTICAGLGLWWLFQRQPVKHQSWEEFRRVYYFDPWEDRPALPKDWVRCEPIDPRIAWTPSQNAFFPEPELDGILSESVKGDMLALKNDPDEKHRTSCHWLIAYNLAGYVPRRSDYNLYMGTVGRILCKPPMNPLEQEEAWRAHFGDLRWDDPRVAERDFLGSNFVAEHLSKVTALFEPLEPYPFDEWLIHLEPTKRKRAVAAQKDIEIMGLACVEAAAERVKLMVKTDELLLKMEKTPHGTFMPQMKPRMIANVNPRVATYVGPHIYALSKKSGKLYGPEADFIRMDIGEKHYWVKISFASGWTDEELTLWRTHSEAFISSHPDDNCFAILVSGDDCLVLGSYEGVRFELETDMSMFDQSQSFGPLNHERMKMRLLGVHKYVIQMIEKTSGATYVMVSRDGQTTIRISRQEREQRDTGGANTSWGNSDVVADAHHLVLRVLCMQDRGQGFCAADIEGLFSQLGFKAKVRLHVYEGDDFAPRSTFLKGMWYVCEPGQYHTTYWGPLPSRILKATKSLKPPRAIYTWIKDEKEAARQFLSDMAYCYSLYVNVPILDVFVQNFCKREVKKVDLLERHQVQSMVGVLKPRLGRAALLQVCERYGITEGDVESFRELYPKDVFYFLAHPVLHALAEVDYA